MKIIKITNQQEFDALPKSFEEFTEIQIFGDVKINFNQENSNVTAWGNSNVTAWGNSNVTARGNSFVRNHSEGLILLFGYSVAIALTKTHKIIKKSSEAIVVYGITKDGNIENWLKLEGISPQDDKKSVILFKKVSEKFLTQEKTDRETEWMVGTTITHSDWKPELKECGENKFHACSCPYFCDEFRSEKNDKYIAIQILIEDLFSWPEPEYPHKIAFRVGKVLYECDRSGNKIE